MVNLIKLVFIGSYIAMVITENQQVANFGIDSHMVDLGFWKGDVNLEVHVWWLVSKCALHASTQELGGSVGMPPFPLPWKILSFKCSEIALQAISGPKVLSVCVHAGVFSHTLQWHTVQELGRLYSHWFTKKWLLSLKFEAVLITLDSYHDLVLGERLLTIKLNVIMMSVLTMPTPFYMWREICLGKIAKLSSSPCYSQEQQQ